MRVQGFEKRIERAELAAKGQSKYSPACICFPENEPPFFTKAANTSLKLGVVTCCNQAVTQACAVCSPF